MKRWVCLLVLTSCGATSEAVITPAGHPGFKILCAKTDDAEGCVREATSDCGPRYTIESKDEHYNSFGPGHGGEMLLEWVIHCH